MLGDKRVATTIPVRDPAQARSFYEGALGLKLSRELADGSIEYQCGEGTSVYTYPTQENAGKSPATLASFEVDDAEAAVGEMRDKGVTFEEYDLPGLKTEGGIAELAGSKGWVVQGAGRQHPGRVPCAARGRAPRRRSGDQPAALLALPGCDWGGAGCRNHRGGL